MRTVMRNLVLGAAMAAVVASGPAIAEVVAQKAPYPCSKKIAYKEVLPGIGAESTASAATHIALGEEAADVEKGIATVIDVQKSCEGTGLVICTAIVTICYK